MLRHILFAQMLRHVAAVDVGLCLHAARLRRFKARSGFCRSELVREAM
jgi:hypothetical protein